MSKAGGMPRAVVLMACLASSAFSHPSAPYPVPIRATPYMPVSAVWRGATLYGTGQRVTVRFIHSIADWGNEVAFMDPRTGQARPLLAYYTGGRGNLCPDSGALSADLGIRDSSDEIVFRLRTLSAAYAGSICTGEACGPRYTGMNNGASRFHSDGEYAHLLGQIWAEMARIPASAADSLPPPCPGQEAPSLAASGALPSPGEGGVLVSFNDGANDTYQDIVILVTGVEMDVERVAPAPAGPPPATAPRAACGIEASAGGVAEGEPFVPGPMALPLSAVRPRASGREPRFFIDQAWRARYPGRPDETAFPNGPEIRISAPGPFVFDLGFFTNRGEFVNRARGEVTPEMLRLAPLLPDGRRQVSLMWYPVSARGERVSTGAYIVKGRIESRPGQDAGGCGAAKADVLSTFGYIRR
jgi:hypothetical protein